MRKIIVYCIEMKNQTKPNKTIYYVRSVNKLLIGVALIIYY